MIKVRLKRDFPGQSAIALIDSMCICRPPAGFKEDPTCYMSNPRILTLVRISVSQSERAVGVPDMKVSVCALIQAACSIGKFRPLTCT